MVSAARQHVSKVFKRMVMGLRLLFQALWYLKAMNREVVCFFQCPVAAQVRAIQTWAMKSSNIHQAQMF
jgi:hypothetical protein